MTFCRYTEIEEGLRDYYHTLVNVVEFKALAWEQLSDMSKKYTFDSKTSADMLKYHFDLILNYTKILFLVDKLPDREILVSCYARAYHKANGNSEGL